MKVRYLASLFLAVFLFNARADLVLVQKIEGGGSVSQLTIKLKGDRARLEGVPQVTTIMDSKSGEMLTLMNEEKKFMRISADKAKAFAAMANKYAGGSEREKPKLTATGKKETINGYETEEFVSEATSFKARYWIARDYPHGDSIMKQLRAMTPASWTNITKGIPDYRDFPGIPLRANMEVAGKEVTTTVVSIKEETINDTEFSPPKDFEEMKVPNIESMIDAKSSASPSVKP
ncbi:MAG: DUF4412 domain-containing protein [Verrucomicrobiota bacterium]